jgi:hypothetical protein
VYANLRGIFSQVTSTQLMGVGCKVRSFEVPNIGSFKTFITWEWLGEAHTENSEFKCVEESWGEPHGYLSQECEAPEEKADKLTYPEGPS